MMIHKVPKLKEKDIQSIRLGCYIKDLSKIKIRKIQK
jgi:hypothetical protein